MADKENALWEEARQGLEVLRLRIAQSPRDSSFFVRRMQKRDVLGNADGYRRRKRRSRGGRHAPGPEHAVPFCEVENESREFGLGCDFEINTEADLVEPPAEARGVVGRCPYLC